MATIDSDPITKIDPAELARSGETIPVAKYNIQHRYEYELNRFMRQIKFIIAGGAVGFTLGLLIGISFASRLTEHNTPIPLATVSSMAVTGLILGVVGGFVAEQATAPKMTSGK